MREYAHYGARHLARGFAAGVAGGVVGSWAMNQFQSLWNRAAGSEKPSAPPRRSPEWQERSEPATTKAVAAIAERVFHHRLTQREKNVADPAIHYAFGAAMGGVYGVLAEMMPAVKTGFGLLYATALWLAADEVAVPALGLGRSPTKSPPLSHAYALASHWVYGLTAEAVRRGVRHAL